jgi:hypothetical protein
MAWHNGMSDAQLYLQRLRETTLAQPTWAMTRETFAAAGAYNEDAPHNAEDLQFFYAHLARGGTLHRVPEPLIIYRGAACCFAFVRVRSPLALPRHTDGGAVAARNVPAELIWAIRVRQLEAVLAQPPWVRDCYGSSLLHRADAPGPRAEQRFHNLECGQGGKEAVPLAQRVGTCCSCRVCRRGCAQAGTRHVRRHAGPQAHTNTTFQVRTRCRCAHVRQRS